ncbi:DUF4880 domain-containing protein [Sphingobium sp. CECT 9361]|uniref:DUF4880 domain-containing protein n=1 Tax=Sphingobium sp. CECT 9361 TaxID=2845384 RepID=UPI001E5F7E70|nr:DUF4880 domain-containing protein [Sphingobium sp. CECT 9361]
MQGSDCGNRQEIEEQAARLLVRYNCDPDEAEKSEICRWIDAHPAHAVAFARAEAAWERSESLKGTAQKASMNVVEMEPISFTQRRNIV